MHQMEYYVAFKKTWILQYSIMWMNLKEILSEKRQLQNTDMAWFHLYEVSMMYNILPVVNDNILYT